MYERANKAYDKGKYDLAHKLSAQSCNSKKAIGCELLGILIKKELSKIAMGIPANKKRGKIINYLEKGHKAGDDKSSAMLFDIYNGGFLFGNVEKANKLIEYLSTRESKAAEIRLKLDCLSNREKNPLKFLVQKCPGLCAWTEEQIERKMSYDVGTLAAIEKVRYGQSCCPEGSCKNPNQKIKSNISNSNSNQ